MAHDNVRTAVAKFALRNKDEEAAEGLLKLSAHYGSGTRFRNACRADERGHVERIVEYARRRAFCLKGAFCARQEASGHLLEVPCRLNRRPCAGRSQRIRERCEEEPGQVRPAPEVPYGVGQLQHCKVDKHACAKVGTSYCSVPRPFGRGTAGGQSISTFHCCTWNRKSDSCPARAAPHPFPVLSAIGPLPENPAPETGCFERFPGPAPGGCRPAPFVRTALPAPAQSLHRAFVVFAGKRTGGRRTPKSGGEMFAHPSAPSALHGQDQILLGRKGRNRPVKKGAAAVHSGACPGTFSGIAGNSPRPFRPWYYRPGL